MRANNAINADSQQQRAAPLLPAADGRRYAQGRGLGRDSKGNAGL